MPIVKADNTNFDIDVIPDTCPYCHHALQPTFYAGSVSKDPSKKDAFLELAVKCTRNDCQRLFLAIYRRNTIQGEDYVGQFKWHRTIPVEPKLPVISQGIRDISDNFEKIYHQSITAESLGLDMIAGVGYRKALEFLIKDYCILKNSDQADSIQKKLLGQVIAEYVVDANIKVCAQRAVWLGNDETHYIRKWQDKDINDLKTLIRLTMNWIENNLLTEQYLATMPQPN